MDQRRTTAHRLKIAEGHLKRVRRMVDEGAYCIDVIHQSRAIQQALKRFDAAVLEHHLNQCVKDQLRTGRKREATKELLAVFDRI
jgi:DNA-binding FrmR family transcriptional regulator